MVPEGKKYLNVGCGTHYIEGWVNTDVWEDSNRPRHDRRW